MVEYATQWSVRSSTHISRMSKIQRYATDGKKKVYVLKRRPISVEFQTCKVSDFGVNFCSESDSFSKLGFQNLPNYLSNYDEYLIHQLNIK